MLITHSYICDRFRWVYCQLEILRHCLPGSVRRVLAQLPETLDETYERILREMPKANREHAHQLLQCLTVAVRPLTVDELAEVLAVDFSADSDGVPKLKEDLRWENQEQAVLSACSSLVTVIVDDRDSRIVQFSHFSVKEFLTSGRLAASNMDTLRQHHILLEPAHTVMAKACLGTLLRFDSEFEVENRKIKKFPLALYAANHIGDHAEFEDVISHIQDGIDCLLDAEKPYFAIWTRIRRGHYENRCVFPPPAPYETPMYYIAHLGFSRMVQYLISRRPQDVNALSGKYNTPLSAALKEGHTEISRLLLAHYPDVDISNSDHETPLHLATYHGTLDIIPMLIERGADVNARARYDETPLHNILRHERTDMMQLLLENNADVNAKDPYYRTPLHVASEFGYLEPARLLLEHGANVHARDYRGKTPLRVSSEEGQFQVMRLLLQHGADPDTQDKDYLQTPLYDGKPAVVRLLLEHGANPHVWAKDGTTPLHYLSKWSHSKWEDDVNKMRALLEYGRNPDVLDKRNNTPLHVASEHGKFKVVQLLIEHGANVNMRNESGDTPLHRSAYGGHLDIMQFLLEHGADINAQCICHNTALHSAVKADSCKLRAVQLLYEHGANVHARNDRGKTPLHGIFLRYRPDPRLIESFLEYGADMDIQADDHSTLLHLASKEAYPELAQLLLEHGASVDTQNDAGQTPLHQAIKGLVVSSTQNGLSVVRILLAHGANVNAQDIDHSTPLHLLATRKYGYLVATQLLLDHGADANMRNNEGKTASDIAEVHYPFSDVWRLLSKHMSERETIPIATVITEG